MIMEMIVMTEKSAAVWRRIKKKDCIHLRKLIETKAKDTKTCGKCDEKADLRACLTCGFVGCCESHKAHNTEHFKKTDHPFIKPYKCNYDWLWCYKCNAFLE